MDWQTTLIVGLAAGYLITAWKTGSIFTHVIAWLEDDMLPSYLSRYSQKLEPLGLKLTELLLCPLCLSPYVCAFLHALIAYYYPSCLIGFAIKLFASSSISYAIYLLNANVLAGKKINT